MSDTGSCLLCSQPISGTEPEGEVLGVEIPRHRDGKTWLASSADADHGQRVAGRAHKDCYSGLYRRLYGVKFE